MALPPYDKVGTQGKQTLVVEGPACDLLGKSRAPSAEACRERGGEELLEYAVQLKANTTERARPEVAFSDIPCKTMSARTSAP